MQHTPTSGVSAVVPPDFLSALFIAASETPDTAFSRHVCFGEGYLGRVAQARKRENDGLCENFVTQPETPAILGVFNSFQLTTPAA